MRLLLSLVILSFCLSANGQFGASLKFNNNAFSDWDANWSESMGTTDALYNTGIEAGLDYWFRLKNQRIEFFPELTYATSTSSLNNNIIESLEYTQFGLNFNTHFYILDLQGDCDCPTWSKDGDFFSKGFFLVLSPGVNFNQFDLNRAGETEPANFNDSRWSYKIGLGAGLDIGINNLLTITPFAMYNYYPSMDNLAFAEWNVAQSGTPNELKTDSPNGQMQFGLRIGFRPDYKY